MFRGNGVVVPRIFIRGQRFFVTIWDVGSRPRRFPFNAGSSRFDSRPASKPRGLSLAATGTACAVADCIRDVRPHLSAPRALVATVKPRVGRGAFVYWSVLERFVPWENEYQTSNDAHESSKIAIGTAYCSESWARRRLFAELTWRRSIRLGCSRSLSGYLIRKLIRTEAPLSGCDSKVLRGDQRCRSTWSGLKPGRAFAPLLVAHQ